MRPRKGAPAVSSQRHLLRLYSCIFESSTYHSFLSTFQSSITSTCSSYDCIFLTVSRTPKCPSPLLYFAISYSPFVLTYSRHSLLHAALKLDICFALSSYYICLSSNISTFRYPVHMNAISFVQTFDDSVPRHKYAGSSKDDFIAQVVIDVLLDGVVFGARLEP